MFRKNHFYEIITKNKEVVKLKGNLTEFPKWDMISTAYMECIHLQNEKFKFLMNRNIF